jgi:hypothetical protein
MSKGKTNQSEALLGWEVYTEGWWENLSEKNLLGSLTREA